jgi:hypothetical protein
MLEGWRYRWLSRDAPLLVDWQGEEEWGVCGGQIKYNNLYLFNNQPKERRGKKKAVNAATMRATRKMTAENSNISYAGGGAGMRSNFVRVMRFSLGDGRWEGWRTTT